MSEAHLTRRQLDQRRNAGLALRDQRGREYYSEIGRMGGRPTFDAWLERARLRDLAAKARSKHGAKKGEAAC